MTFSASPPTAGWGSSGTRAISSAGRDRDRPHPGPARRPDQQPMDWVTFSPDGSRLVGTTNDPPSAQVIDLSAIRRGLAAMGLDWDAPAFPATTRPAPTSRHCPRSKVDYGILRRTSKITRRARSHCVGAVHRADRAGSRRRRCLSPSRPRPGGAESRRRRPSTTCPGRSASGPTTPISCTNGPGSWPSPSRNGSPRSPTSNRR